LSESAADGPAARQSLRHWLLSLQPPLAVFAQDVLGSDDRIDLVARDEHGGVILILVDHRLADLPGSLERPPDAALLARALAQIEWLQARLPDWAQLAPGLSLAGEHPVRAWLVAPSFDAGTRAAARVLGERIRLVEARPAGLPLRVRLDDVEAPAAVPAEPPGPGEDGARGDDPAPGPEPEPPPALGTAGVFRSGLSEADLRLDAAERRELADPV